MMAEFGRKGDRQHWKQSAHLGRALLEHLALMAA